MEFGGSNGRQILLLSLVVLIIPMLVFPNRLGTGLVQASLIYIIYELVYYGVITFVLTGRRSLVPLAQGAGVCLVFRLALGATYGLLIAAMYSMNARVSLTLGMSSYMPAVLLHVLTVPFILSPALRQWLMPPKTRPAARPQAQETEAPMEGKTTFVTTAPSSRPAPQPAFRTDTTARKEPAERETRPYRPGDADGFERAARYLGEDGSVQVAAVVDLEGLLLGHFKRGGHDAEAWAPLALLFYEQNQDVIDRFGGGVPERIAFMLKDRKVIVAREDTFFLMVVAERQNDDVLNIRISQGLDIVRKYVAERYGHDRAVNTEKSYVRSTQ